jgi:alkylation response protein AidB-like acyl-CoA dehydrogenase
MSEALTPVTPAGERFVAAAAALIPAFRERAADADLAQAVCESNFEDIASSGIAAAFVPEQLGGMGLASVHDWTLGIATLARGDASTAIGINMHLGVSRGFAAAADGGGAAGAVLAAIESGEMLICATATESGTDNLRPLTEATRTDEGWEINGTKRFVTMSPVATHLAMNLRIRDAEGDRIGSTLMPIATPGVEPLGDWDALGMRASGSQSIHFTRVRMPEVAVRAMGPWGRWSVASLAQRALANLPLVGAFLGIAEAAHEITLETLSHQRRNEAPTNQDPGVQHAVAEMEIELSQCRAVTTRAGLFADAFVALEHPTLEQGHALMKEYQTAKWIVNRGAIQIVNRAMDLVGGASFMAGHPLSRLYRDVRAGPFMQPGAPVEARDYIGRVALGLLPEG